MAVEQRRIIVTGANGFIGSCIVERLVRDGARVIGFVRNVERSRSELPDGVELVRWSHDDAEGDWRRHVDGADGVINLAGANIGQRWTESHRKLVRESRVLGTRHLVEAIAAATRRPKVLVNASAVGYYGGSPAGTVTEETPAADDFLARVCREWEEEATKARALGVRVAIVRTGVALHPEEGALARLLPVFRLFAGGPIGSGRQPFPWIHIDDVVGIFLWALDEERVDEPVNATAPEVVTNREFARELGHAIGRPSFIPAPELAIRLMLGEAAVIVTGGQWAIPKRTEELGYRFRHRELRPALASLLQH